MVNYFVFTLVLLLSFSFDLEAISPQLPYCDRNETSIRYTPVVKTRTEVKLPTGIFKSFKKTKTYIVSYIEQEQHIQWRMISSCCEGYRMSPELQICEPECAQRCPQHSSCVEPNRCQCKRGYISAAVPTNGAHYCEPICEQRCPVNGRCAEPNVCECVKGFYAEGGQCIEKSNATDKHVESTVEAVEKQLGSTVEAVAKLFGSTVEADVDVEVTTSKNFEAAIAVEEEQQFEMDLDENEKIYLSTPSTESSEAATSDTTSSSKCTAGNIYYNGDCRAQVFPSNEVDCRVNACGENAICQSNGSCTCADGHVWHRMGSIALSRAKPILEGSGNSDESSEEDEELEDSSDKLDVVSNTELMCVSLLQLGATYFNSADAVTTEDNDEGWLGILLVALGAAIVVSALVFLGLKLVRRQSGQLDVEGKSDLCCAYDNKQQILVL